MSYSQDDIEDDVRELMAAKEELSSSRAVATTHAMLAALHLTPASVEPKFAAACQFVAAVLSRLRRDPNPLEMPLWAFETHANRLWALQQQVRSGSCEASRGSKEYAQAAREMDGRDEGRRRPAANITNWVPCCAQMAGESKLKLWQDLGDMSTQEAQLRYLSIVTELAPQWMDPLSTDSALLRTWTPDDDSDRCMICDEVFTFLNRRHHCRRCASLVCAVCSPHTLPLRVFSRKPHKPQRICSVCFDEMDQHVSAGTTVPPSTTHISIHDPKATSAMAQHRPPPVIDSFAMEAEDTSASTVHSSYSSSSSMALAAMTASSSFPTKPLSLQSLAATIHCGVLDCLHGAGFRKTWHSYFFVLLVRKGSLGMFLSETDHVEKKKRPAAVYKLSGYTIRIKSQKRRPHQFRLTHANKKPLHFAATCIEDMNAWISQLIKAVENANELERKLHVGSKSSPQSVETVAHAQAPVPPSDDHDEPSG